MKNVTVFKEMLVLATLSVFGVGCVAGTGSITDPIRICPAVMRAVGLDSLQVTSYQANLQKLSLSLEIDNPGHDIGGPCEEAAYTLDVEVLIFDQAVVLGAYDDNDALAIVPIHLGQVDGSVSKAIAQALVAGTTYYIVVRDIHGMAEVMTSYLVPGAVDDVEDDPELVLDVL